MKNTLFIGILLIFSAVSLGQSVENITAETVDNKIRINYQISGLKYHQNISEIELFVKKADDINFSGPMGHVTGDINGGLRNGEHSIIWDAINEMTIDDNPLVFDIRISVVDEEVSREFLVMLVGNDIAPFGIRFGQLGRTSWYVEARASLLAFNNPQYIFSNGDIIDYNQDDYYEISGGKGWQAYSFVGGLTQQISRNLFLYAGAGYGVEKYILELNNYHYSDPIAISESLAEFKEYSTSGIEVDAGMMLNLKRILIGAGGTTINFSSFGWTASLGIKF